MSEPKISFFGALPVSIEKHSLFAPNDEDRARIQKLVEAEWSGRSPIGDYVRLPISDITTDAYYATLRVLRERFG